MKLFSKLSILLLVVIAMSTQAAQAKGEKSVYVFGIATSFQDSTMYVTAIQQLDSVTIDKKSKALSGIHQLNKQFSTYLHTISKVEYVEVLYYQEDKKDIEKKYIKICKRFAGDKAYKMITIPTDKFAYFNNHGVVEVYGVTHKLEGKPIEED
ncbi:MAG: hypothetical protein RR386_00105 [Bacteroidaceae bacterium]